MISKNQIKFIRQLEQKKHRLREGVYVAEGTKVVDDLLEHYKADMLFATQDYLSNRPDISHLSKNITEVSNEELSQISYQQHPQQVLAIFPLPSYTTPFQPSDKKLSLALDDIQDPGNMGTIIRIADWFGIDTIVCSHQTVDAWNPKVVQATMGSIARVNIIYNDLPTLLRSLPADYPVYGTFLDGDNIYQQTLTSHGLIVMGNEGNGISDSVGQFINRRLLIPDFHNGNTADSLNVAVATAIVCSEFRRRI